MAEAEEGAAPVVDLAPEFAPEELLSFCLIGKTLMAKQKIEEDPRVINLGSPNVRVPSNLTDASCLQS